MDSQVPAVTIIILKCEVVSLMNFLSIYKIYGNKSPKKWKTVLGFIMLFNPY